MSKIDQPETVVNNTESTKVRDPQADVETLPDLESPQVNNNVDEAPSLSMIVAELRLECADQRAIVNRLRADLHVAMANLDRLVRQVGDVQSVSHHSSRSVPRFSYTERRPAPIEFRHRMPPQSPVFLYPEDPVYEFYSRGRY